VTAACMGGFCAIRESCRNFTSPSSREAPAERLCDRGEDGLRSRPSEEQRVLRSVPGEWRLSGQELAIARRMRSSLFSAGAGGD
jgi:hypothetical protein